MTTAAAPPRTRRQLLRWLVVLIVVVSLGLAASVGLRELRAGAAWREAAEAIDRRDFPRALERLEHYLAERPTDAEAVFLAARTARRANDLRRAEQLLREADRLGWVDNALLLERSLLRVHRGALYAEEGYLTACVRNGHPDSVIILEVLTVAYARTFNVPAATEMLERWAELEPNNPTPLCLRAELAVHSRRKREALDLYERAVGLKADDAEARLGYGKLLLELNRPAEALPQFEWLAARDGKDPAVRLGLARSRIGMGEVGAGTELLEGLRAERPDDPEVLLDLGKLELGRDPARAEGLLRRAVAAQPYEPEPCFALARCLEALGKHDEVERLRDRQKRAEQELKRLGELTRAIAVQPRDPALRCEAGEILIRNGQEEAGAEWLRTALEIDPNHGPSHAALAAHYERTGDPARAAAHRRVANVPAARPATSPP